jgi:glycosyltransferase involved in cell wall biosynthesis
VLPIPEWLTPDSRRLPEPHEIEPWFRAVCELWDDPEAYEQAAASARRVAESHYSERVLRQQYLDYFTKLERGACLFDATRDA